MCGGFYLACRSSKGLPGSRGSDTPSTDQGTLSTWLRLARGYRSGGFGQSSIASGTRFVKDSRRSLNSKVPDGTGMVDYGQ